MKYLSIPIKLIKRLINKFQKDSVSDTPFLDMMPEVSKEKRIDDYKNC